jgi:hypothetical protein
MIVPSGTRFGIVRGISYGLFGKPDEFVAQARELGAGLVRAYVYWGQVEPEPGRYVWDAVDALLAQLDGSEEVWVTVCSSSRWATREPTDFLPPSPALDPDAYHAFVRRLVAYCAGRVHYWQCDNEPSNAGLLWSGSDAEYVAQLKVMYRAVKEADPRASVVLGGCGYDVFASEERSPQRQFFDHLLREGRDAFDLFDAHLYGDPTLIPEYVEAARQMMRVHGYQKPVVAGEYNGPLLFEFPEIGAVLQETLAAAFADTSALASGTSALAVDTEELKARTTQDTPERRAMVALYARMPDLPPKLQMFMAGCPAEWEEKRHRMNCRDLVMRNLLALSVGVPRIVCWNLAPEVPEPVEPYSVMGLMFAKLKLMDYEGGELTHRYPAAETFTLLTGQLAGVRSVTRVDVVERPGLFAFEVERSGHGPLLVLWDQRDAFDGEAEPPVNVEWPWSAPDASAVDAFGADHPVRVRDGKLRLAVSLTPVFVSATAA